ncbi:chemotaxis protein CheA [Granulosicoccaceae sp. 1_MG-2023]|nr:chemotaxis protein CheA [Granulosicoccaceae sp. 1_MG-2023]
MSIDLSEFHDIFFEECTEGLSVMEEGLLTLDKGADVEEINAIFRAAHSIKGGSASFGFTAISGFTHVMETLLDEMRDGRREVTREIVDLLLESVDVLRDMVTAAREEDESENQRTAEVQAKLERVLAGQAEAEPEAEAPAAAGAGSDSAASPAEAAPETEEPVQDADGTPAAAAGWKISFAPHESLLRSGNDPARIFRELERLGRLEVASDSADLPLFNAITPENSYLRWDLTLYGDIAEADIRELFSWVEDECDLTLTPFSAVEAVPAESEPAAPAAAPAEAAAAPAPQAVPESVAPDAAPAEVAEVAAKPSPAAAETEPKAAPKPAAKKQASNKESGSIRVGIDKVDALINMVGELVITQSMLSQISSNLEEGTTKNFDKLLDGITQLERNTRELQESVLQIRMLPISFSFSRFPRLVRDLSKSMGKQIELKMTGEHTEVDKTVLEKIGDPLVHLVRNSLDHGIETPDVRREKGKPETGVLELCAYHEGGDIIIQVKDDGAGLSRERILGKAVEKGLVSENEDLSDERVYNLIFMPGFSTADKISDVSGRGVGMDVVRRNVRDLGGNVTINNNAGGAGSTVTIRLPLTLAILDGQLVRIGQETFIVSLVSIVESLQMKREMINSITGQSELYRVRDEYIPIIRVNRLFGTREGTEDLLDGLLVVVESDGQRVGLFVDDLLGQQQVVIKSLETNFKQIQGISGATILGDGTVALIMDVPGLIQKHFESCKRADSGRAAAA